MIRSASVFPVPPDPPLPAPTHTLTVIRSTPAGTVQACSPGWSNVTVCEAAAGVCGAVKAPVVATVATATAAPSRRRKRKTFSSVFTDRKRSYVSGVRPSDSFAPPPSPSAPACSPAPPNCTRSERARSQACPKTNPRSSPAAHAGRPQGARTQGIEAGKQRTVIDLELVRLLAGMRFGTSLPIPVRLTRPGRNPGLRRSFARHDPYASLCGRLAARPCRPRILRPRSSRRRTSGLHGRRLLP